MTLASDPNHIERFVGALFRYAEGGSFVSLRAFDQFDRGRKALFVEGVPVAIDGGLQKIIARAVERSTEAAGQDDPVAVFAPPVATFSDSYRARTDDLKNGLAISVEVDAGDTAMARTKLEGLLGPATIVVQSGGEWIDDRTGEIHPKLHIHWRLSEATTTPQEHQRLQDARWLAAVLVGADRSAAPSAHPLRWPGSWNRKAAPKLAMIVAENPDAEVHLADALGTLQEAVEAAGLNQGTSGSAKASAPPQAPLHLVAEALRTIPNLEVHWDEWVRIGLATWNATGGSSEGLDAWSAWSAKSNKHSNEACSERWAHFAGSPPGKIGAGTIFFLAKCAGWHDPRKRTSENSTEPPSADSDDPGYQPNESGPTRSRRRTDGDGIVWGPAVDFLSTDATGAPTLKEEHLPAPLWPFVLDVSQRLGVDPYCVLLPSLASCATVMSDEWDVQPKRHDHTWTENPRIWIGIVGDPSILKTPVLSACTKPIDKLEIEARKRHAEAMRQWENDCAVAKLDKLAPPRQPKCDRYMVEGTTTEALSEVLRDDEDARFRTPTKKVMVRQDELTELFGNLDRYKAGGKGGGDRAVYLKLYNGGRATIDRIGRGSFAVPNWSATFAGGIQPGPIQKIAREAADDGLLQRFMLAVPSDQARGVDRAADHDAIRRYNDLFPALIDLRPIREVGFDYIRAVTLSEGAHAFREQINDLATALSAMPDTSPRLKASFGKWPGLFARLCLIYHLIEVADSQARGDVGLYPRVITAETAGRVAALMEDIVLPHLLRADALMYSTEQTGHARWIAGFILARQLTQIEYRDIARSYKALKAPEAKAEVISIMDNLSALGWLHPDEPPIQGKHSVRWFVNPTVHQTFAARREAEAGRRAKARQDLADAFQRIRDRKSKGGDQ